MRAHAAEGARTGAVAAPAAGVCVGAMLSLLAAFGRQSVVGVSLHQSVHVVLTITSVAALAWGVCAALLRAHARAVPLVVGPTLAMSLLPLLVGAAGARIEWAHAMRRLPSPYDALPGPERGMFVFGLGAIASAALCVGVGIALRRIAAQETTRTAPAPAWLAFAVLPVCVACIVEAFARWVLPGSRGLTGATAHALRDWDTLLASLPVLRAIVAGTVALLVGIAVAAAIRGRSFRTLGIATLVVALLSGTAAVAQAVVDGADQAVSRTVGYQLARVPALIATPVSDYDYRGAIDLAVGVDFVADDHGHRWALGDLARVARVAHEEDGPRPLALEWEGVGYGYGRTYLPGDPHLDIAIDARLRGMQLGRLVHGLARAGIGKIRIVGPDAASVPNDGVRSPLLRIGSRRYRAANASLEGWDLKARSKDLFLARVTRVDGTTVGLASARGRMRTWQVERGRVTPVHRASVGEDEPDLLLEALRGGRPDPVVAWVPVTLGTVTEVVRAVSLLGAAGVAPVLCVDRCP